MTFFKAQEDYKKKDEAFQRSNSLYESKEQAFRDGQAGILAEKLKDGEKCPVCGSTTHPHPAKLTDEVPSEKIILGLPFYTKLWKTKNNETIRRSFICKFKLLVLFNYFYFYYFLLFI